MCLFSTWGQGRAVGSFKVGIWFWDEKREISENRFLVFWINLQNYRFFDFVGKAFWVQMVDF